MDQDYRPIPARELRRLAEKADGRRGVPQFIVRIRTGKQEQYDVLTPSEIAAAEQGGAKVERLMPVESDYWQSDRRKREKETVVTITVPDAKPRTYNAEEVDALFLTEAAVEKFVLPYYARTLDPDGYAGLVKRYYSSKSTAWALIHYPTSQYGFLEGDELEGDDER